MIETDARGSHAADPRVVRLPVIIRPTGQDAGPLNFPPNAHLDATLTLTFLFSSIQQSDDTLTKVRTIISEQLGTDLDAVAADAKFVDLGADSLDTVEIMMALEEEFEITLDEEGAEKIATVQEAADMIQEQMA